MKIYLIIFILLATAACKGGSSQISPVYYSVAQMTGANIIPVNVSCGYMNEPCVSVTICNPTIPTQCQTVDNILLDTGSYGLRVFSSAVQKVGLTTITSGSGQLAECQNYLDNSADWGPLAMAYVQLGGEITSQPIAIQLIDAYFPADSPPAEVGAQNAGCDKPDKDPSDSGFNGILGVGPRIADCGSGCLSSSNFTYFSCTSDGTCTNVAVAVDSQVSNPIAFLAPDNSGSTSFDVNNGSALILPTLGVPGAAGASGYLILGIGTTTNNTADPTTVSVIQTTANDPSFTTTFEGHSYPGSFIDSGSNGLFFPSLGTNMPTDASGFYDPSAITAFTATFTVASVQHSIGFNILGSSIAFSENSPNLAFNDIGAEYSGGFDWGLPFFFGRTVYVGIEGKNSNLGTGPFWAF